ncbi:hypothetical protein LEP1GSC178_1465 [Leptospira licerasiae str. MMD4847]|uniref:Uncharacterized protein n=1 Tax=Leptospira licerasiae str. MMD4847 TaxID=1049971 RepID=A0ABN0H476_9LEPT|nr:hypothetical protein LEP1GSC178_1465 [Leptospira licerasiae str. MMD4847]
MTIRFLIHCRQFRPEVHLQYEETFALLDQWTDFHPFFP